MATYDYLLQGHVWKRSREAQRELEKQYDVPYLPNVSQVEPFAKAAKSQFVSQITQSAKATNMGGIRNIVAPHFINTLLKEVSLGDIKEEGGLETISEKESDCCVLNKNFRTDSYDIGVVIQVYRIDKMPSLVGPLS